LSNWKISVACKRAGVDVAIIGQVNDALNALIQALKDQKLVNIDAWWKQIKGWRAFGSANFAPIAAGNPKPIVPKPPELIQRRGLSNG
jgi:thiamine pyrophosphate-dependent acetolactate synthase large subunit-like protein